MAKKVDDKQTVETPAKEKKAVAKNEPKKVPAKKLPKIYKKQYTQKAFEKKLLKHLYIETDKDLVKQLFETSTDKKGRTVMVVPKDKEIAKMVLQDLPQITLRASLNYSEELQKQ
mgnify:CR=1 FL=1